VDKPVDKTRERCEAMAENDAVEYVEEFMGRKLPAAAYHDTWSQQEMDRAKRSADLINEARETLDWDQLRTCWIAIRLSDGGSDMVIYDRKQDAVRHQLHEQQCAYVSFRNLVNGATAREMLRFLRFYDMAYTQGMRLADPDDPDGGRDLAPTTGWMDYIGGRAKR
jgi:hypothetical protein